MKILCGYPLSTRAISIPLISKARCFKLICFEDAKIYFQWKISHILSSAIIRQKLKTTMKVISKCTLINQIPVYCGFNMLISADLSASVAQVDAPSDWRPGGRGFNPRRGRQHSFVEIDHEIFSTAFSPFRWFKKGSCQFLAKECAQYWLTA